MLFVNKRFEPFTNPVVKGSEDERNELIAAAF